VEKIEKIGDQQLNVEKILALQPDLALVTDFQHENNPDILKQFKDAGIEVIVIGSAESFENVYNTISLIGTVTGAKDEADRIVKDMKDRLAEIQEKAKGVTEKKRVWVEVSPSPDIFTTGKNTFLHEMLESINAINTAGEQTGWVKMTEEEIVTLNPDVIITTYGYYIEKPADQVLSRSGWGEVPAIKNEQVFDVNNDTVTRPGPRLIDGVETLAKLIYPEIFGK
jgi:iron complex transport system substrate-binding protein